MEERDDIVAIRNISTEADESQAKILLTNRCYKAQKYLFKKLKGELQIQKEAYRNINKEKLNLETEIKLAEKNNENVLVIYESIKSVNIELKKEWLLAKERKSETIQRMETGEKKYEEHWLKCKKRYESLPYAQKLQQATDLSQTLKQITNNLAEKAQTLILEIKTKKTTLIDSDRKRIIEMANFIVRELPLGIKMAKEKQLEIVKLTQFIKKQESYKELAIKSLQIKHVCEEETNMDVDEGVANVSNIISNSQFIMPKVQLLNDLDIFSIKLGQIKKDDAVITATAKRTGSTTALLDKKSEVAKGADDKRFPSYYNEVKTDDYIYDKQKQVDYSKNKLVHILESKELKTNDVHTFLYNVNFDALKGVDVIAGIDTRAQPPSNDKVNEDVENEEIEVLDLTCSRSQNILLPPSPFMDLHLEMFNTSQKYVPTTDPMACEEIPIENECDKKRVSFDLPVQEAMELTENENINTDKEYASDKANETNNIKMDIGVASDENFDIIKEMMLKRHKLDSSPQFVYPKNTALQMRNHDKLVTSKFFNKSDKTDLKVHEDKLSADEVNQNIDEKECPTESEPKNTMSKQNVLQKEQNQLSEMEVSGFLFTHSDDVSESLDLSSSVAVYEEGDMDFPYCIDSSVLLSPKADLPMSVSGEKADEPQDTPNFLTGFRKTESFFRQPSASDPKPDSSAPNQESNFSFNFKGEEKKGRGSIFSMFN